MSTHFFIAIDNADFDALLNGYPYPHQAAPMWDSYAAALPQRQLWKNTRWLYDPQDGSARAALTFREFSLRRMKFLWLQEGPVWIGGAPSQAEEQSFLTRLAEFVSAADPQVDFIRFNAWNEHSALVRPCQDLSFHDTTVVISLEGDEEALRSRMKTRGRRMVNKAVRLAQTEVRNCTDIDRKGFEKLLTIMDETSERQEFNALSHDHYWLFFTKMREIGKVRLYAGFIDDEPVNWALYTMHNGRVQYEVAASNEAARRDGATTKAVYHALLAFQQEGYKELDLIAIGSDYNPRLNGLNQFKTQWVKESTYVGQPMELVLHPMKYKLMNWIGGFLGR